MRAAPRTNAPRRLAGFGACLLGAICLLSAGQVSAADILIKRATWNDSWNGLSVSGSATPRTEVTLVNAYDTDQVLGDDRTSRRSGSWGIRVRNPSPAPCRVRAIDADGQIAERDVSNAPADCAPTAPGGGNTPPTADANGPYTGSAGVAVQFSSAGSNDSDGSITGYAWNFGDGASSSAANPSHTYSSAGNYTVSLTVTDNDGDTGADATTADIAPPANVPPTAEANGPYTGSAGVAVQFSSAGSNDSDGSITGYAWDFGDGNTSSAENPSHTYSSAGNYTVSLTVTDNDGGTGTDATTADIAPPANVPPTAEANGPYTGTVGVAVQFSSAGSTDSDGTIDTYAWDFGDGNTSDAENPSHTYSARLAPTRCRLRSPTTRGRAIPPPLRPRSPTRWPAPRRFRSIVRSRRTPGLRSVWTATSKSRSTCTARCTTSRVGPSPT